MEVRRRQNVGRRHEIVAGVGYRFAGSVLHNSERLAYLPERETLHFVTAFVHDEVEFTRNLRVMLGSKFERNSYTGFEWQPALRATWTATHEQTLWAAVTRAVRTPARVDRGIQVLVSAAPGPGGLPLVISIEGSRDYESEDLKAVEVGYRWNRGPVSADVTAFRTGYDKLRGTRTGEMRLGSYEGQTVRILPQEFVNAFDATAYGAELSMTWQPIARWKVIGSHTWLNVTATERDPNAAGSLEGPVPEHQFHVRTYLDLPANIEAGALLYADSANAPLGVQAYRKLDLTMRWRTRASFDLSMTVQNLFHAGDIEFIDRAAPLSLPVQTTAFAEIAWRF